MDNSIKRNNGDNKNICNIKYCIKIRLSFTDQREFYDDKGWDLFIFI